MNTIKTLESQKEKLYRPKRILLAGYILSILIAITVFITGGTYNVYGNFMYIAIGIVSSTNSKRHSIIHALTSGLLMGPIMPLISSTLTMQEPITWIIRLIIYIMSALLISYYSSKLSKDEKQLLEKDNELQLAQKSTLLSLVKISETRDAETGQHIDRIVYLTKYLLEVLCKTKEYKELDKASIKCIAEASALHDIGKVAIPDCILLKQGKLTKEEFDIMKSHTSRGALELKSIKEVYPNNDFINYGYEIAKYHHEWIDGSGYPEGIKGDSIPLHARVVAILDVYDALRAKRPYKDAYTHDEALSIMKKESSRHFDKKIFSTFLSKHIEINQIYLSFN